MLNNVYAVYAAACVYAKEVIVCKQWNSLLCPEEFILLYNPL